jgi:hypothetical protein
LSTAHDYAWRTGVDAAQCDQVRAAMRSLETESPRERLGADQVRLVELQPGDVGDSDRRIAGSTGMFAGSGTLLAVQVLMQVAGYRRLGADHIHHRLSNY